MPARDSIRPTPRYLALVAAASELARTMGHGYVGAEHLFLAIIRDHEAVPTQVLATVSDPALIDERLRDLMGSPGYKTPRE